MSRDIPIIFSAPMVRAFLREIAAPGTGKTMTRRLAWKPAGGSMVECEHGFDTCPDCDKPRPSPWQRVQADDRLWVREGWKPHSLYAAMKPREMPKTNVFYLADQKYEPSNVRGLPSIHMPRWASRMTLTVTATKIERLQDISEADALAEGVECRGDRDYWAGENRGTDAVACFSALWMSLHGIGSWNENPEVVALSLQAIKANIDAPEARAA